MQKSARKFSHDLNCTTYSPVDSGGAGGARAPSEFGGSEKGRSLISAYRSLLLGSYYKYGTYTCYRPNQAFMIIFDLPRIDEIV